MGVGCFLLALRKLSSECKTFLEKWSDQGCLCKASDHLPENLEMKKEIKVFIVFIIYFLNILNV